MAAAEAAAARAPKLTGKAAKKAARAAMLASAAEAAAEAAATAAAADSKDEAAEPAPPELASATQAGLSQSHAYICSVTMFPGNFAWQGLQVSCCCRSLAHEMWPSFCT